MLRIITAYGGLLLKAMGQTLYYTQKKARGQRPHAIVFYKLSKILSKDFVILTV